MKGIEKARMGMIAVMAVMLVAITRRLMGARRLSSGMIVLAVAGMVLLVAAGGAGAVDITGCTVINDPGTYNIIQDITNGTEYYCIDIRSDDVILDGGGHLIDGVNDASNSCGIRARRIDSMGDSVTIRNVEITNFDSGIHVEASGPVQGVEAKFTNVLIENCVIHGNGVNRGQGIKLLHVCDSTIRHNDVYDQTGTGTGCESGGNGIFLLGDGANHGWARNNILTYNNIYDNVKAGIFTKASPDYNTISYNNCWENGEPGHGATGGIVMRCMQCNDNNIAHNDASDNFGDGIFCRGNSNTFEFNTAVGNSDAGIDIGATPPGGDGGDNNELYHNTACDNGRVDICTCGGADTSGCYGNHGDDNTCDTTSNYDDDGTTGCIYSCAPPEKPDLVITEKSETLDDSTFKVTYTVANTGGADAGASTTGIYAGSTQIATDSVGALTAGASHTSTVTIDPFDCPCGTTVTIKVCADEGDAVDESDETNNCRENTFSCPPCPVEPQLCTNPDLPAYDFGSVQQGQTRTWTFEITNCGGKTLTWTVSDDRPWITVSPTGGSTTTETDTVTVTIDTTGLTVGATHTGTITVGSNDGTKTGAISVSVQSGPVSPQLCTNSDPPSYDFGSVQVGQARTWTFDITNCGGETLTWTVNDDQPWITVSPTGGSTTTEIDAVTVTIDTAGLADGAHSGTVTVGSNDGTKTGTIGVHVETSLPIPPPPPAVVPTLTPIGIGILALFGLLGIVAISSIGKGGSE